LLSEPGPSIVNRLVSWSAESDAPLVLKANVRPGGVAPLVQLVRELDPDCSLLSYAGNGAVFIKLSAIPSMGASKLLISKLQPAAASLGGRIIVLGGSAATEATMQTVWGPGDPALELMRAVKRKFDPNGILNPGRFVV
jgi:hypothetical protein